MSQKNKKNQSNYWRRQAAKPVFVLLSGVMTGCLVSAPFVSADQFDQQIQQLQNQNAQTQGSVSALVAQANSYQDEINLLQGQINTIQGLIAANQAKQAELQQQIVQAQAELDQQKQVLGSDIKAMYVGGQMTTIEELASSKNLSDFVDAETYRNAVQSEVQNTLVKITQLQNQLKDQKTQVDQLVSDEQTQQNQLDSTEAQQQQLLSYNQSQQDQYNQQIQTNNAQIASLRAQQLAANHALGGQIVAGDPGHGGYPAEWDYPVAQDSVIDNWGMYNRECVSYTAWKVHQAYTEGIFKNDMPYWGGEGNANEWPADAQRSGIPTGSTPKVNSVAISMAGGYGHAMWVQQVSGNMIYVSQYNFNLDGRYSEMWVNGSNFIYLYFN